MGSTLRRTLLCGTVLALASCGTVRAPSPADQAPGGAVAAAHGSQQPPRQRAAQQAAGLLASFAPPPGARKLPAAPAVSGGVLRHPAFTSGDPDVATAVSWWYVPAPASAVFSYERAHLPRGFTWGGPGAIGSAVPAPSRPGHPVPAGDLQLTPRPLGSAYGAWLETWDSAGGSGELTVEVAYPAAGRTYVRVYSDVTWVPVRPASERVPAGVGAVEVTAQPDMNKPRDVPRPVLVTDPARVRQIVALADGLSLEAAGVRFCPMETGKGITLAFLARPGGVVLATLSEQLPSCGIVRFVIGGKQQPALSPTVTFLPDVLKVARVTWAGWSG